MSLAMRKPTFIPRTPAEPPPPLSRSERLRAWLSHQREAWSRDLRDWSGVREWFADRWEEVGLFWRGTRGLIDLINIALFARFTRAEIDEMRELAVATGRTPPHAFALFAGAVTLFIVFEYAIEFGLPWPITQGFIVRTVFLAWQVVRICVYLGSVFTPGPAIRQPPYISPRKELPEIPPEEDEKWH